MNQSTLAMDAMGYVLFGYNVSFCEQNQGGFFWYVATLSFQFLSEKKTC